jgi:predicted N-acetyltransferase YhbS
MPSPSLHFRPAEAADVPTLTALIEASVRSLFAAVHTPRQVESALRFVFGVDSRIIADSTYYVAEADGQVVGAGGWSRRRTPFGGDQATQVHDEALRDPATDPAVIRAFFVHPAWTRRGIGRHLLALCEDAARREGYRHFELVATLSGVPLYAALGFRETEPLSIALPDGVVLPAVKMVKP